MVESSTGIVALLAGNAALWFYLENRTRSVVFQFFPPLMFIYIVSAVFANTGIVASKSPVYDWMGNDLLPVIVILLLLRVDVVNTVRLAGKSVGLMLIGSASVVIGAPIALALVHHWLAPDAWQGFGALAGSWIGGTANMAAVARGLNISGTQFGLAVLANNTVDLLWIPLMLQSKRLAGWYSGGNTATHSAPEDDANAETAEGAVLRRAPELRHYIYLVAIAFSAAQAAGWLGSLMPELPPVLSRATYAIVIVTTIGIALSCTRLRDIPGSHELAMACVYLFVARMGATAVLDGVADQAVPFVAGAFIWIAIHGAILLIAGRMMGVSIHMVAICSAANIGGAATAPVIAAFHDRRLIPVSILLAILGYAIGNYGAFLAAYLCSKV